MSSLAKGATSNRGTRAEPASTMANVGDPGMLEVVAVAPTAGGRIQESPSYDPGMADELRSADPASFTQGLQGQIDVAPPRAPSRAVGSRAAGEARSDRNGLPLLLTADEVAALLRTTRKAVYAMAERAALPGVIRLGRRILVDRDELLRWLDEKRAPSPGRTRR